MNRFIVANTPQEIAQALCDKHVVKMPLEEAQMLCTVVRQANRTVWHMPSIHAHCGQDRHVPTTCLLTAYGKPCVWSTPTDTVGIMHQNVLLRHCMTVHDMCLVVREHHTLNASVSTHT